MERIALFAASNVTDEEEIASAYHSSLQEEEGMKVVGGGELTVDYEAKNIQFTTTSKSFGNCDGVLALKVLSTGFGMGYNVSLK